MRILKHDEIIINEIKEYLILQNLFIPLLLIVITSARHFSISGRDINGINEINQSELGLWREKRGIGKRKCGDVCERLLNERVDSRWHEWHIFLVAMRVNG